MNVQLTRMCHTRGFAIGVAAVCVLALALYHFGGLGEALAGDNGVALPSANEWLGSGAMSFVAAILSMAGTATIMLLLNKVHNVMRAMTSLYIAFFSVMELATPALTSQFYSGSVLAVAVPMCMLMLFNCYKRPEATRTIFLIFFILSALAATQTCYAVYIIMMLIGCGQMGIFKRRTLSAALMGLLTPWIIMLGFGIVDFEQIRIPRIISVFSAEDYNNTILAIATMGLTALLMLVCYTLNVIRTIAYNAAARAVNGVFTFTSLFTIIAMAADFNNAAVYVPLLNFCAAMEATHYFSTHRADRSYIAIFSLIAVYTAIFVCQTLI